MTIDIEQLLERVNLVQLAERVGGQLRRSGNGRRDACPLHGVDNPTAFSIYTDDRGRQRWRCEHCGHPHDPDCGYTLTVHHLDGNPANCSWENMVALCQRCHLRWQRAWRPGQMMFDFARPEWMERRGHGLGPSGDLAVAADDPIAAPRLEASTRASTPQFTPSTGPKAGEVRRRG